MKWQILQQLKESKIQEQFKQNLHLGFKMTNPPQVLNYVLDPLVEEACSLWLQGALSFPKGCKETLKLF